MSRWFKTFTLTMFALSAFFIILGLWVWAMMEAVLRDGHLHDFEFRGGFFNVPLFTAPLDAALTLVPKGHIAAVINAGCDDPRAPDFMRGSAAVFVPNAGSQDAAITAATPALALYAAGLGAIAQEQSK